MKENFGFLKFFFEEGNIAAVGEETATAILSHDQNAGLSAERFLAETEELLESGMWCIDLSRGMVQLTPTLSHFIFGSEAGPMIPLDSFIQIISERDRNAFQQNLNTVERMGKPFTLELTINTFGGQEKEFLVRAKSLGTNRVFGVFKDQSPMEQNLLELNRSNQELEQFAYVASHDLQEPLRKILMYSERLKGRLGQEVSEDAHLCMKRIEASATNMRVLIDNLLELSRANRNTNAYSQISLHNLFSEIVLDLELKINETGAKVHVSSSLPILEGVCSELKQVFTNLLLNAMKFTRPGVVPEIQIACSELTEQERRHYHLEADRAYRIDVVDNGIGFEESDSERIFQAFQRLHGRSEYPGSGIGLAICKKITENHRGLIFAHSIPGKGSTFTVILPEKH